jgi:hypothetical protein
MPIFVIYDMNKTGIKLNFLNWPAKMWVFVAGAMILVITLFVSDVTIVSSGFSDNVQGWSWNGYQFAGQTEGIGLGWVSLNCLNDFDNDGSVEYQCGPGSINYGLNVDLGSNGVFGHTIPPQRDYLKDCSWSSYYGWVCYNEGGQCPTGGAGGACDQLSSDGIWIVNTANFYRLISPDYNALDGSWTLSGSTDEIQARILSLYDVAAAPKNAIVFPFSDDATRDPLDTGNYGDPGGLNNGRTEFDSSWQVYGCTGCDTVGSNQPCDACITMSVTNDPDIDDNPNPNFLCWDCTDCAVDEVGGSCTLSKRRNKCLASSCSQCTDYPGVLVNEPSAGEFELCGWGYHAYDEDGTVKGLGWMSFGAEIEIPDFAYVDIGKGSVFSGGSIWSPVVPPVNKYNAAYIIEASGDITNWFSKNSLRYAERITSPGFLKKQGTGIYKNVLGKLDFDGLVTDVSSGTPLSGSPGTTGTNKYGQTILLGDATDETSINADLFTAALDDKVIYYDCDSASSIEVHGNANNTFKIGSGSTSGAGIIVVNCDLAINLGTSGGPPGRKKILYEGGGSPTRLSHVPAVVWIVKGDVIIQPVMTDISGNFIVLGKRGQCTNDPGITCNVDSECVGGTCLDAVNECPAMASGYPANGCGRFSSGDDSASPTQLTIYGSVFAQQFNFQRGYSSTLEPAEKFNSQGRLQSNPPTGMSDFAKSVPRFSGGF